MLYPISSVDRLTLCQGDSQANESHDIFFNVLGNDNPNDSTNPTIPNTIEQVPCTVIVFIATENVNK